MTQTGELRFALAWNNVVLIIKLKLDTDQTTVYLEGPSTCLKGGIPKALNGLIKAVERDYVYKPQTYISMV